MLYSRELLEFYRQKFSEYDQEYHELVEKIDKYDLASKQLVCIKMYRDFSTM